MPCSTSSQENSPYCATNPLKVARNHFCWACQKSPKQTGDIEFNPTKNHIGNNCITTPTINLPLMKTIVLKIIFVLRSIFSVLPNKISSILGAFGLSEIIKRDSGVRYTANVFKTKYLINCRGDYAVERNATSKLIASDEPFMGIKHLGLKDFVFLDIGANVGAYSVGAAAIGAKIVYSVEPGPLFNRLVENIALNKLQERITAFHIGLSSKNGKMFWHEDLNNPGNAHLVGENQFVSVPNAKTKLSDKFVAVDVITLQQLSSAFAGTRVDLIKIDVEGMEWDVIEGGKDLIEKWMPVIVSETPRYNSGSEPENRVKQLFKYLYSIGYKSLRYKNRIFQEVKYPNFDQDTFFIPEKSVGLEKVLARK
jgi:FkbM family methyltransferase